MKEITVTDTTDAFTSFAVHGLREKNKGARFMNRD